MKTLLLTRVTHKPERWEQRLLTGAIGAQLEMHLYTPSLCTERGGSPKILGSGAFLKGSCARASPLDVRGIPFVGSSAQTTPGDGERVGRELQSPSSLARAGAAP